MSEQEREMRRSEELLHRFLDGDLSPEEQSELDAFLAEDPELAESRNDLTEIGTMLRSHINHEVDAVDFTDFYAGIEGRLGEEAAPTPAVERAPVVEESPGLLEQVRSWFSDNWMPAVVGAAAAAAVGFWVVGAGDSKGDAGVDGSPVVVDAISNEGNKTVLVSMPTQEGESTVIWLLDSEEEDQAPIEGEDPI